MKFGSVFGFVILARFWIMCRCLVISMKVAGSYLDEGV